MDGKSFTYVNSYVRKINKLYMNSETSDVKFVCDMDTDHPETIPAHKSILSMDNPIFYAMFYGPVKEKGDILIKDTCAAAFKEFLQFFYLGKVTLTSENIAQVMNLCKKYDMKECMTVCETTLQNSLTMDDMCFGYSIAVLYEQENLTKFCEQRIINTSAREIIKSESFLECERNLLEKILMLVSSKWSALEVVIACMEWAKAQCDRNNLELKPSNIRYQLGELFNWIPFENLTLEQFSQHFITYSGFFDLDEIGTINKKILLRSQQSNKFDLQLLPVNNPKSLHRGYSLNCDRRECSNSSTIKSKTYIGFTTKFSTNRNLLLTKFQIPIRPQQRITYRILEIKLNKPFPVLAVIQSKKNRIVLPKGCFIEAGKEYAVFATIENGEQMENATLKNVVQLEDNIEIRFLPDEFGSTYDLVSRLIFEIL